MRPSTHTHYRYGTACPQELADFETVCRKDLARRAMKSVLQKIKNSGMTSWMHWVSRYIPDIQRDHPWRKQESAMEIQASNSSDIE